MATQTFDAPTQEALDPAADTNGAAAGGTDPAASLDLNDPRLTSEVLEVNPDGDAYATIPPIPDGIYRAKFTQVDVKGPDGKPARYAARQDKNGALYAFTAVQADIIGVGGQEMYDGIKLPDHFVDTQVRRRSESSRVSTVIGKLGGQVPQRDSIAGWMARLEKVLSGQPEGGIETVWEAACMQCDEAAKKDGTRKQGTFLKGEHRFPMAKKVVAGVVHDPNVQCPTCKQWVLAQVRIHRYLSLGELLKRG